MTSDDFDQSELQKKLRYLQESDSKIIEKIKQLVKNNSELEKNICKLNDIKNDAEARLRYIETINIEKVKEEVHKLESRIHSLESKQTDNKEKWKKIFDFIVQLLWVSMAAWLLTKLGLQAPL